MKTKIDESALAEEEVSVDVPVFAKTSGVSVSSAFGIVLAPHQLAWTIRDDNLVITTQTVASDCRQMKVYDISDLVATWGDLPVKEPPRFSKLGLLKIGR